MSDAMEGIRNSGDRTIVLAATSMDVIAQAAMEADRLGLVGDEYLWLLADIPIRSASCTEGDDDEGCKDRKDQKATNTQHALSASKAAALKKLLQGAGRIQVLDGFTVDPENDAFAKVWRETTDLGLIDSLNEQFRMQGASYQAPPDYFQTCSPPRYASFVFDAMVATGLSVCHLQARRKTSGADDTEETAYEEGSENGFVDSILKTSFRGASGRVEFSQHTQSRVTNSVVYGVYNFQPVAPAGISSSSNDNGDYLFKPVLTSIRRNEGQWEDLAPYLYYGGTPSPPSVLREMRNLQSLSPRVLYGGLALMVISLCISVSVASWVYVHRKHRLVRASQPQFLYLLCIGSILCSLTIGVLSMEHTSDRYSTTYLDFACASTPWFSFVGYIMAYMALFCKLRRINKILQFTRLAVRYYDVTRPFAAMLFWTVLILTVWTIWDPPRWELAVVSDSTTYESMGRCTSRFFPIFASLLFLLAATATAMTVVMAWLTKDIQEELSESRWIFGALSSQLQMWLVTLPLIHYGRSMPLASTTNDVIYAARVLFIATFSISIVVTVMFPKIFSVIVGERRERDGNYNDAASVGSSHTMGSTMFGGSGTVRISGLTTQGRQPSLMYRRPSGSSNNSISAALKVAREEPTDEGSLSASEVAEEAEREPRIGRRFSDSTIRTSSFSSSGRLFGIIEVNLDDQRPVSPASLSSSNLATRMTNVCKSQEKGDLDTGDLHYDNNNTFDSDLFAQNHQLEENDDHSLCGDDDNKNLKELQYRIQWLKKMKRQLDVNA